MTIEIFDPDNKDVVMNATMGNMKRQSTGENTNTKVLRFNLTNIDCKLDPATGNELCESAVLLEVKQGADYTITLCAMNKFGSTCEHFQQSVDVVLLDSAAGELNRNKLQSGVSVGTVVGIVVGILVPAVVCFMLLIVYFVRRNRKRRIGESVPQDDFEFEG